MKFKIFSFLLIFILLFSWIGVHGSRDQVKKRLDVSSCYTLRYDAFDNCLSKKLIEFSESNSIISTFAELRALLKEGKLKENCHTSMHIFGRWSSEHLGNDSLKGDMNICGGGFLHGIMQYNFVNADKDSLIKVIDSLCLSQGVDTEMCIHGVGHSSALINLPLVDAASLCQSIALDAKLSPQSIDGYRNTYQCMSGWFMESTARDKYWINNKVTSSDVKLFCKSLVEQELINNLFYQCSIAWFKQWISSTVTSEPDLSKNNLIYMANWCDNVAKRLVIKDVSSITGNPLSDICWGEYGSLIATLLINDSNIDKVDSNISFINSNCSKYAIFICYNSYMYTTFSEVGDKYEYFSEFCKRIPLIYKRNCLEGVKRERI